MVLQQADPMSQQCSCMELAENTSPITSQASSPGRAHCIWVAGFDGPSISPLNDAPYLRRCCCQTPVPHVQFQKNDRWGGIHFAKNSSKNDMALFSKDDATKDSSRLTSNNYDLARSQSTVILRSTYTTLLIPKACVRRRCRVSSPRRRSKRPSQVVGKNETTVLYTESSQLLLYCTAKRLEEKVRPETRLDKTK